MKLSNEPIEPGQPVKFTLAGFPEEEVLRASAERFYALKPDADKRFLIYNTFEEEIFSGLINEEGKIQDLTATSRPGQA